MAAGKFILNLDDGSEIRLALIAPADWIQYADRFRTERKVAHALTLHLSGVEGADLRRELEEFDARPLAQWHVQQWVLCLEGAAEMLALSIRRGWELWRNGACERSQPPDMTAGIDQIPAEITVDRYEAAAAGVAQLKLVPKDQPAEGGEKKDGGQSIGTGDPKPTESASG